jgi:hypothetical protein
VHAFVLVCAGRHPLPAVVIPPAIFEAFAVLQRSGAMAVNAEPRGLPGRSSHQRWLLDRPQRHEVERWLLVLSSVGADVDVT